MLLSKKFKKKRVGQKKKRKEIKFTNLFNLVQTKNQITMANPRKFSEKIALHNQKQLEETAAFEKIMREVSDATQKVK